MRASLLPLAAASCLAVATLAGACGDDKGGTVAGEDTGAVTEDADGASDATAADDAGDATGGADTGDDAAGSDVIEPPPLNAAPTTRGQVFWLGYMENLTLAFNGPPHFALQITAEEATRGKVEIPRTGFVQIFEVPAGGAVEVALPDGILYPQLNETATDLGVRVSADDPVRVTAIHYRLHFSEATPVLPSGELADRYVVLAGEDAGGQSPSELLIVATRDGTVVEIGPSAVTSGFHAPGNPFRVTLDAGQTYQLQAAQDLSGTTVQALGGERLAVFGGARQANVGCTGADNHLWEQLLPPARWATDYVVVPLGGGAGPTPLRILADRVKTVVEVSCQTQVVVDPGKGVAVNVAKPTVLRGSAPIAVGAFVKSAGCAGTAGGDPNLALVAPARLTTRRATFKRVRGVSTLEDAKHWLTVVARAADTGAVTLDGQALTGWAPFPDEPALATVTAEVDDDDAHTLATGGEGGFQAMLYGYGFYDSYAFHLGWDCDDCDATGLGGHAPATGCDPGDTTIRTTTTPGGDPDDPRRICGGPCDCWERLGDPGGACAGDGDPVWACVDGMCEGACGDPCDACPAVFPQDEQGRCIAP